MARKKKTTNETFNPMKVISDIIHADWPKVYGYGREAKFGQLSKVALMAEQEGFKVVPQGSKANVIGINDPLTGKRLVTPYMNQKGTAVYLCLNGIGTRTKNPALPDDIKAFCEKREWSFKQDGNYHSLVTSIDDFTVDDFKALVELLPTTTRQPSTQNTRPAK